MADDGRLAFEEFYARYHRRLLGFAISTYGRDDADDFAQDAMVRAYASYARLDPARDPWPWLVAIVRNVARDRYARPTAVPLADVPVESADETAGVEERAMVRAALGRLSSDDRAMLVLREWHELTFGELSGLLGRSPNTLRQQAFRARRRLADAYTALGGRAMGLLAWVRWRVPVAGQVAAVLVTGALVPTPAAPEVRERPPVTAGPAAHGGSTAGPAARATPARPLRPPGTTRSARPADRPQRRPAGRVPPPAEQPRERGGGLTVTAGDAGHRHASAEPGTPLHCAVTAAICGAR